MFNRFTLVLFSIVVIGASVAWVLSAPRPLVSAELAGLTEGVVGSGEQVFWAGGCASCHAAPNSTGSDKLKLSGGLEFKTPFGEFVAPNISPHPTSGLGKWSLNDFANAMKRGVRPDGAHYYPAFPYTSYTHITNTDISNL